MLILYQNLKTNAETAPSNGANWDESIEQIGTKALKKHLNQNFLMQIKFIAHFGWDPNTNFSYNKIIFCNPPPPPFLCSYMPPLFCDVH